MVHGRIVGFDVSPAAVDESARALSDACCAPEMFRGVCADFFSVQPPTDIESIVDPVDIVVGNPPYIRYQTFNGTSRIQAAARCLAAGVKMGSLASSWAPFVIHASSFLNPGGRLALVLPEELIHSSYAEPVRNFLRASFRTTTIVSFENHVFPGSQERVVLMIADGYLAARCGFLQILRVGSPEALDTLAQSLNTAESFEPDEKPEKWLPGARKEEHRLLRRLEDTGLFVRLSRLGKAGIGYVSGANEFFVLTRDEARAHRLPLRTLTPTLTAARHSDSGRAPERQG